MNESVSFPAKRVEAVGVPLAGRPETCRMFESDFIERFSRIHPVSPFVFWVPIICLMLYRSEGRYEAGQLSLAAIPGLFVLGFFAWTLTEYILHRHVFHWVNDTAWGKRIHFLLHGVHHDFPSDKDRLVMPLGFSIPLGALFYIAFYFVLGTRIGEPFYAGMVLGYLFYDGSHYAIHHFKPSTRFGKYVKRHHMLHHHNDHGGGYGVSTPLWDIIFRSMPSTKRQKSR